MTILITGATGYIGNPLTFMLANEGNIIHALVRQPEKTTSLDHPNIKLFKGDVTDIDSIRKAMNGCDQVYHLASFAKLCAMPHDIFYTINVDGTRNMLQVAIEKNISGFVYTSSTAVFGNSIHSPMIESDPRTIGFDNDYDLSKCMAEKLVLDFAAKGLHAMIVNPSRVYGPGKKTFSNPFTRFLSNILKGKPILIPDCPDVIANYSYLNDVVNGHVLAMKNGKTGERYILGGENISYRQLLDAVKEIIPVKKTISIPKFILKLAGHGQLLWYYVSKKQPAFMANDIERYFRNTEFNCSKATREINYSITPFRQGISETINHLKKELYASQK